MKTTVIYILLAISARLFTANLTSLIEQFQKAAQ